MPLLVDRHDDGFTRVGGPPHFVLLPLLQDHVVAEDIRQLHFGPCGTAASAIPAAQATAEKCRTRDAAQRRTADLFRCEMPAAFVRALSADCMVSVPCCKLSIIESAELFCGPHYIGVA